MLNWKKIGLEMRQLNDTEKITSQVLFYTMFAINKIILLG